MNILGIVCARSGSKGLKNKNTKQFNGKPLIMWSLEKLKKINKFHKYIVSTDDEQIINICKKINIDIIFKRPKYLSNSAASKIDVWKHAYKKACKHYNCEFDALVDIDCSNPMQKLKSINDLLNWSIKQKIKKNNFDISLFVTKSRKNPYFNMFEKKGNFFKLSKQLSNVHTRQSAPEVYDHVAGTYFVQNKFLKSSKYLNKAKVIGYEISRFESFDIDDKLDFEICRRLMDKYK